VKDFIGTWPYSRSGIYGSRRFQRRSCKSGCLTAIRINRVKAQKAEKTRRKSRRFVGRVLGGIPKNREGDFRVPLSVIGCCLPVNPFVA
jgi:hypothetical protein